MNEHSRIAREYRAHERQDEYYHGTNETRSIIGLGLNGSLYLNLCAKEHLLYENNLLCTIKAAFAAENEHPFLHMVSDWLGVNGSWAAHDPAEAKQALLEYLEESCGEFKRMEDLEEFSTKFKELDKAAYGSREKGRTGGTWHATAINNVMAERGLPYEVSGGNKGPWTLKKKGDESNG